ncbi:hypothetical protein [Sinorhizobium terangae]|uniref:hypothetical protein n=1 Tax=Sinorhizobium terangae TaxID=110322 RepID=UPI0024B113FC|nr:hypothetical protein [Sinorhizobium terangae]WFU50724.1 hypothetical protein QA637_18975 [Sinorhizobium terangae]
MDVFGAIISIFGLFWLSRMPLAERLLGQPKTLSDALLHARRRFLEWLAELPGWPGGALIVVGGLMIIFAISFELRA